MAWPTLHDYNEAIQNAAACFADTDLNKSIAAKKVKKSKLSLFGAAAWLPLVGIIIAASGGCGKTDIPNKQDVARVEPIEELPKVVIPPLEKTDAEDPKTAGKKDDGPAKKFGEMAAKTGSDDSRPQADLGTKPAMAPFRFKEFDWKTGDPAIKLIESTKGFSVLTLVGGQFESGSEQVSLHKQNDGFWYINSRAGKRIVCDAMNVEFADAAPVMETKEYHWKSGDARVKMIAATDGFCFLSGVAGKFQAGGEMVRVHLDADGYWYLSGSTAASISAKATSVRFAEKGAYSITAKEHTWSKGQQAVPMIKKDEGFCFLSHIHGSLRGGGEVAKVYVGKDDTWHLSGRTGQNSLVVKAYSITIAKVAATAKQPSKDRSETPVAKVPAKQPSKDRSETPVLLKSPFTKAQAEKARTDWARFLNIPESKELDLGKGVKMELVLIPPGEFMMGVANEQRPVIIGRPFYMAVTETTQEQFEAIMQSNPSSFSPTGNHKDKVDGLETSKFPVEKVTWDEVLKFAAKINAQAPTEAEWEYACRAGTTTEFNFGDSLNGMQANCDGTKPFGAGEGQNLERTAKVGSYAPNAFGLCDMHGNVREWCHRVEIEASNPVEADPEMPPQPAGKDPVFRGGSWHIEAEQCRSASRQSYDPTMRLPYTGFRVIVSAPDNPSANKK